MAELSDGTAYCSHTRSLFQNIMVDKMVWQINLERINDYPLYLQFTSNYSPDKKKNPSADDRENTKETEFTVISKSEIPNDAILIPADSPFSSIYTKKNKSLYSKL